MTAKKLKITISTEPVRIGSHIKIRSLLEACRQSSLDLIDKQTHLKPSLREVLKAEVAAVSRSDYVFVAKDAGQPVAAISVRFKPPTKRGCSVWSVWIIHGYVLPEYRRLGLYSKLMKALIKDSKARGVPVVMSGNFVHQQRATSSSQ